MTPPDAAPAGTMPSAPVPVTSMPVDAAALRKARAQALEVRVDEPERMAIFVGNDRRPQSIGAIARERRGEGLCNVERACVERHADLSIGACPISTRHVGGRIDAARYGQA